MRLWPWGNRPFLDAEDEAWQAETWAWFLRHFGGLDDLRRSPLVAPTRHFFPPSDATGHERAAHVFEQVKRHARMPDWHCRLEPQAERPEAQVGEFSILNFDKGDPAGTFSVQGNEVVITYDPAAVGDPANLVATLAHELCHYRLKTIRELPPGGEAMEEPATDLATVYFGFGLFGAACAFNFLQHGDTFSQGWRWRRLGYLSPRAWCYGLAMFLTLRGETAEVAKPFLQPHLLSDVREAAAYLQRRPERRAVT